METTKAKSPSGGALSLAALGIVFGDIGASPLYTLKTVLDYTGPHPDAAATLGALSLILWTLFIITTVKYVNFAMRIDNDGEGGVIALMTLLGVPALVAVCKAKRANLDLDDVTYYVGHETIAPRDDGSGAPRRQQAMYAFMGRNSARISDFLKLPWDQVVEIGREIEI